MNAFQNAFYQPSFVFPGRLGPNYAKFIWEATSHEVNMLHNMLHNMLQVLTAVHSFTPTVVAEHVHSTQLK